jgi:pyruvate dehydrogenase E2 component (dihydrolipoamide acetyltransferase)
VAIKEVLVPDIGSDSADIIEILVKPGQRIAENDPVAVLESAKASMEIPSPFTGVVKEIRVAVGQQAKENDVLLLMELEGSEAPVAASPAAAPQVAANAPAAMPMQEIKRELEHVSTVLAPGLSAGATSLKVVTVPDIGSDEADVIELLVKPGDRITLEQSIVILESAKASMEVPSTAAGVVKRLLVQVGDKVSQDKPLLEVEVEEGAASAPSPVAAAVPAPVAAASPAPAPAIASAPSEPVAVIPAGPLAHAGPAVRKLARELGVDLGKVPGSGPKNRVLKEDVHAYVKKTLSEPPKPVAAPAAAGSGLPPLPEIDFAKFGEIELKPLTKIQKLSAQNLHRAWLHIPHVTQFDEADITEMEAFRVAQKDALKAQGIGLTPLSFLVCACAHALRKMPKFNTSLSRDGESLVWKKYIHIGVAVDTPNGLVVPVIRNADQKSITAIARELGELSAKARDKKLMPADMQGATFSISSLGGIGGTAFTPIVNWPEVAILGVSRSAQKPVWDGKVFVPRLMLPLSLSYDHRVVDGADAARFTSLLGKLLGDIRQLLL